MHSEGFPVEGFCMAAGIPNTKNAAQIIDALKSSGIHIASEPGSVNGLHQVVNITKANLDLPIILWWSGGRAIHMKTSTSRSCRPTGP